MIYTPKIRFFQHNSVAPAFSAHLSLWFLFQCFLPGTLVLLTSWALSYEDSTDRILQKPSVVTRTDHWEKRVGMLRKSLMRHLGAEHGGNCAQWPGLTASQQWLKLFKWETGASSPRLKHQSSSKDNKLTHWSTRVLLRIMNSLT